MKRALLFFSMIVLAVPIASGAELAIGAKAPGFSLTNAVDGKKVVFAPGDGKLSVVVFTCNQCPYARAFEDRLVALGRQYSARGVRFYAIDPNDETKYDVERMVVMKQRALAKNYPYPYLKDGDSSVARAYGARVTPHVFVVDGSGVVRYRVYVDDSAKPAQRTDEGLKNALESTLAGKPVPVAATRAFGCTIKWSGE